MYLRKILIVCISILLIACGSGSEQLEIPSERPMGIIQGNVLGGLYSGGTITAYTLNDHEKRQYLADSVVQENGKFQLQFSSISQPVLVEVRGGSYVDPVSRISTVAEPEFVMSKILMFQSGDTHNIVISPFSHLATGLVLHKIESEKTSPKKINLPQVVKELDDLFSINSDAQELEIIFQQDQNALLIKGDEKQGLLVDALSQLAYDESTSRQDSLQALYSLSSLNSLMYEDIRSDGKLDGKSIQIDSNEEKLLVFGDTKINQDFYRVTLAMAVKKSMENASLEILSEKSEQENFLFVLAESQSGLLGEASDVGLKTTVPSIRFSSTPAAIVKGSFVIDFRVENALKLQTVNVMLNNLEIASYRNPVEEIFSVTVSSTDFVDGQHEVIINVKDSYENSASLKLPVVFDNSPPVVEIHSSSLTKYDNFVLDGSFSDEFSKVKKIIVNGEDAVITNTQWSKSVSLMSGVNEFVITIEDELGNSRKIDTQVTLDDTGAGITFTSAALTSDEHYLLEGTFFDSLSAISKITVNGENVDITGENSWSMPVILNNGINAFIVGVSDQAGNYSESTTEVILDMQAPVVTVNSIAVTKNSDFQLQGEFKDDLSAVKQITVNGEQAILINEKNWNIPVSLSSGKNNFTIGVSDDADNYTEFSTTITLDLTAPVVRVTSAPLTNNNHFILKGDFEELISSVAALVVNGNQATILAENKWEFEVDLSSGDNSFVIGIEDLAGNYSEITSHVYLDDIKPIAIYNGVSLTNTPELVLKGTFADNLVEIDGIKINGLDATIEKANNWSMPVTLSGGENEFSIRVVDKAGNASESFVKVVLDDLPPLVNFSDSLQVRYSNNDGSYFSDFLMLNNSVPFYIDTTQLSLYGMEASRKNLINKKIPFYAFSFIDQAIGGLETPMTDLKVKYRYFINSSEIVPWQSISFSKNSNEILLPIVAETLSNQWYKVTPEDVHMLEITVSDNAGNVTTQQATFQTQFYVPDIKLTINNDLESLDDGMFATRSEYVNKEVVGLNYNLSNSSDRNFRIKLSDRAVHSVIQSYEEVQRQNKVQLQSREKWQRSTVTNLVDSCPTLKGDWQPVTTMWNYIGDQWIKTLPQIKKLEVVDVDTDNPKPPAATAWKVYSAADEDYFPYVNTLGNEILSYFFDYIFNYDTVSLHEASKQPGFVTSWSLKTNSKTISCPELNAMQTMKEYDYLSVDGFPRNNLSVKNVKKEFSTTRFVVLDQDQSKIEANNAWYTIPAGHKVTIKKYVRTPSLTLYTDSKVANLQNIKDYNLHRYDKSLNWNIGAGLQIDSQFNPDGILNDEVSTKVQQIELPAESFNFQR